jgi:HTH-type transcriptional repressor of NAD biosynthesis genes
MKTVGFIGGKFYPLHSGHVFAITYASNLVDELYVVLTHSEKRERKLSVKDNFPYVDSSTRLSWLGKLVSEMDNVFIIEIEDDYGVEDYSWEEGAEKIKKEIGKEIDFVFSSEIRYSETFDRLYPNAKHIVIDNERNAVNVSATEIRQDVYGNWDRMPNYVRAEFVKRIAVIGTESCGKSTLVKNLARVFNTNYVAEYGRDICEEYSNFLTKNMFDEIAFKQKVHEIDKVKDSNKVLFIDSEVVVTQYYFNIYFNNEKELYNEMAKNQEYDLYLFLEPDVKWVADGLRSQGEEKVREDNNEVLKGMFDELGIEYKIINGDYLNRFNKSFKLVNDLINSGGVV